MVRQTGEFEREQEPLLHCQNVTAIPANVHAVEELKYRPSKREKLVAYLCFLILGATVLLPWNLIIVVLPYFSYRMRSLSPALSQAAVSWITLVFTVGNFAFLLQSTFAQKHQGVSSLQNKISFSIPLLGGIILLLLLSTWLELLEGKLYLAFILLISVICSGICAITQSSSAALAALFDDAKYIQGLMSGQGAIGFAVAVTQLTAALHAQNTASHRRGSAAPGDEENAKLIQSTSSFFVISLVFVLVAWVSWVMLRRLPMYKHFIDERKLHDTQSQHLQNQASLSMIRAFPDSEPSLLVIEKKVRHLGCALFYIFTVTIGLFPGVATSVESLHPDTWLGAKLVWIPVGFVTFNLGDWMGRSLPSINGLIFRHKRVLCFSSYLRTLFIPLMLMCNVQTSTPGSLTDKVTFFASDSAYITILFLLAISNGYLCSLLMMRAVTEATLEPEEVDIASSIMLIYLTAGLVSGALLSFLIRWLAM